MERDLAKDLKDSVKAAKTKGKYTGPANLKRSFSNADIDKSNSFVSKCGSQGPIISFYSRSVTWMFLFLSP